MNARAICNSSVVQIYWSYAKPISNCLGFKLERIETGGATQILPAWVGFTSQSNQDWQPKDTSIWPVQKFNWRDLTATPGKTYTYRITPMTGSPDKLTPATTQALVTNEVSLTSELGSFTASFTNGILATQGLVHYLESQHQQPNSTSLIQHISVPGDPLRNRLAGPSIGTLTQLIDTVKTKGGTLHCALYELNDTELIKALLSIPAGHLYLLLGNTPTNESVLPAFGKPSKEVMAAALGADHFHYRTVPSSHIAHNKFVLYTDPSGTPAAVLTGSTNWTQSGICTQSNNQLILHSKDMGSLYQAYWQRLLDDTVSSGSKQAPALRTADNIPSGATIDTATVSFWASPNTKQTSKGTAVPSDLQQVFQLMAAARQAILFLVFQPGSPSVLDQALLCQENNPNLFIRGAATDPSAVENYDTSLFHYGIKDPDTVVAASAVNDQFAYWQKELLKTAGAHAIIHDKIVVIDPFSPDCVVIAGSHNLGFKASYCNDENFVIIKGHQLLAAAYATHILDVYDHYRWRYTLEQSPGDRSAFFGLAEDDTWQSKYFNASTTPMQRFWQADTVPPGKKPTAPLVGTPGVALITPAPKKAAGSKPAAKKAAGPTPAAKKAPKAAPVKQAAPQVAKKAAKKAAPKVVKKRPRKPRPKSPKKQPRP